MPTDRLVRFSIPGMMFLLSVTFLYYFFGFPLPDFSAKEKMLDSNYILAIIGIFISSPIIGIIISTIALGIMFLFRGYGIYYYVPNDQKTVRYLMKDARKKEQQAIIGVFKFKGCKNYFRRRKRN